MQTRWVLALAGLCLCAAGIAVGEAAAVPDDKSINRPAAEPIPGAGGNAALFFGVNEFTDTSVATLKYAVNDAIALAHVFIIEIGVIPPARATLLVSGQPVGEAAVAQLAALRERGVRVRTADRNGFLEEFEWLLAQPEGDASLLLVSFSTHGFDADRTPYVLPADGKRRLLQQSAIDLNQVEADLGGARAGKRLLLVDACRERAATADAKATSLPVLSPGLLRELALARGQAIWASCKDNEFSYEHDRAPHGVFTHFLIEGLRGRATADSTGLIRVGALKEYVGAAVQDWARQRGKQQEPWFEGPHGAEKIPLAVAAERRAEVHAAIRRLREMAVNRELEIAELHEAEALLDNPAPQQADLARLQVYLELGLGRRKVSEARSLLAALPKGDADPDRTGSQPPDRPQPPVAGPVPPRFAAWVGRYMPMHSERPAGKYVMCSLRELRITKIENGVVTAELCERTEKVGDVRGELTGDELVLHFSAATGRINWPEFDMTIGAGSDGGAYAAWGGRNAGDRVHAVRLADRTITLVELGPDAKLITPDRFRDAGRTGEHRAATIRNGQIPLYTASVSGQEIDVADLCTERGIRLRGTLALPDSVVQNTRSRRERTAVVRIIKDARDEIGKLTVTLAKPEAPLDVLVPKGTLKVYFEVERRGLTHDLALMGLTAGPER